MYTCIIKITAEDRNKKLKNVYPTPWIPPDWQELFQAVFRTFKKFKNLKDNRFND